MPLTKLLKYPSQLFLKKSISFLVVRRFDLNEHEEYLRYIAVKPNASISSLRLKVWHLLELPDFCEETIVLKSSEGQEISLTQLRHGNDPQHPFILEVWSPSNLKGHASTASTCSNSTACRMLCPSAQQLPMTNKIDEQTIISKPKPEKFRKSNGFKPSRTSINVMNMFCDGDQKFNAHKDLFGHELGSRMSMVSVKNILGLKGKKNFASILLDIQSDLQLLTTKVSMLENKVN